jgi:bacillithiol biosynthesis cysteine-adding enzyme BshC
MLASFSSAFLRRDSKAARFLPADYRDADARRHVVQKQASRPLPVSPAVWRELAAQQAALGESPGRRRSLDALRQPGTVVVVSGQQLGLFLGPLYTFYKAASAIQLARSIEAEQGVRCVPIFWLQTEDHDFEEIRHCHLPIFDGEGDLDGLTLSLSPDLTADQATGTADAARCPLDRQSVEHRRLDTEIGPLQQALREALGGLPYATDCLDLFAAHYRAGAALSTAFAGAMATLFADEGLIVLNPRRSAIAHEAAAMYRLAITRQADVARVLTARGQDLLHAGFDEQVAVRANTSLFFFHETPTGPRFRLERSAGDDRWLLPQRAGQARAARTTAELLDALAQDPLCFSTSALLRPLLQDTLLPTVAYVGGPGEINYWAQLAPLYELFAESLPLQQPLVVPRARFRCVDDSTRSLLSRLGLEAGEIERPREDAIALALLRQGLSADAGDAASHRLDTTTASQALRQQLLQDVLARLDGLAHSEPGLRDALRRTRVSIERNIDRLLRRYQHIASERDAVLCRRVDRLQRVLYPRGAPQERHYSLPYYLAQHGLPALKDRVFHSLRTHDCSHTAVRDLDL